jgi:hypothetical protein
MGNLGGSRRPALSRCFACARVALIAFGAPAMVAIVAGAALAQQAKPEAAVAKSRGAARSPGPKKASGPPDAGSQSNSAGALAAPTPVALPGSVPSNDAGLSEYKTLDSGTRVFKFTELDIEGQLKSPQLVYFLRRVRAEFAAGDLGHRSFMREMSETRKESSF